MPSGGVDLGVTKAVNPPRAGSFSTRMAVHEVHGHGDVLFTSQIVGANRYVNPPGGYVVGIGDRAAPRSCWGEMQVLSAVTITVDIMLMESILLRNH